MEIRTIGIDLGKTVFHLVGVNTGGKVVVRKKCSRTQLLRFTSNLRECLIGMRPAGDLISWAALCGNRGMRCA
jgi:transposase